MGNLNRPRLVIAGTGSGCGKTTVTAGIMAALSARSIPVFPFKVGPDYIDPMFHQLTSGRPGRNLDGCLMSAETLREAFLNHSEADGISVIEGVMGLFDGLGVTERGSTAQTAGDLKAPIVLVLDGKGMSLSAAALTQGYHEFLPRIRLSGVIFNRVKSSAQYQLLKTAVESKLNIPVLGYLPPLPKSLESRHLGLMTPEEVMDLSEQMSKLSEAVAQTIDLDKVIEIAGRAPLLDLPLKKGISFPKFSDVTIGVARDKAFSFYYEDNLELLEKMGAKLVFFSPLKDEKIPEGVKGLYFGGGYPESYGEALEKNQSMRLSVKKAAQEGMAIYGECGGMMYLADKLKDGTGKTWNMAGVFSGGVEMTKKLHHFGYVNCQITKACILGQKGVVFQGHEFHYSREYLEAEACMGVTRLRGGTEEWIGAYQEGNCVAGYPHIHFYNCPEIAVNFMKSC